MSEHLSVDPAFGQADLSNCERELIHLAGSVQSHGLLLVLDEPGLVIRQASANTGQWLGLPPGRLIGQPLQTLGGDGRRQVSALCVQDLAEPVPLHCAFAADGTLRLFDGRLHRTAGGALVLELESAAVQSGLPTAEIAHAPLLQRVRTAVESFGAASSVDALADAVVQCVHDIIGYDRVMVYRFDPDGHGKIIAEVREPRLESLLGHQYPASDIPQRARDLYLRNRVRMLVDVDAPEAPLLPRQPAGGELDMSMCQLRSMSPLHLQYLRNMGVTATLVVSLVREGRLWGLIAAHHYAPRHLRPEVRAACDLLAEVISTRLAAIENYAHAQVGILVRRLEQRLLEATSVEGDWRLALFRNPHTLLQPLEATGAALFHDGEVLTAGEVPSTPELRALRDRVDGRPGDPPLACASLAQVDPSLASLSPTASGVLAVRLSKSRADLLMWFRKEQVQTVTWGGDPNKPKLGDSPFALSPRRSFAAWSEIVRGTARPWSDSEIALARAFGVALADLIVQVHAVRLLIAEHQMVQIRATMNSAREAVAVADAQGRLLFWNAPLAELLGGLATPPATLDELAGHFADPVSLRASWQALSGARLTWRGEHSLQRPGRTPLPLGLRIDPVPGHDGVLLGVVLTLTDLSESQRTAASRRALEDRLRPAARETDAVMRAIFTHASLAAMDITDGPGGPALAPRLDEVEASAKRAALLYRQIRAASDGG